MIPLQKLTSDAVTALNCKVIYTMRDPKDVSVSLYKLYYNRTFPFGTYNGHFEDFLHLFIDRTGLTLS